MGYKKEAIKGISWTWLLRIVTRGSSFVRLAIIARILTPTQFGLYGIAALVLSLLEVFTETGINILVIQSNTNLKKIINTAWIISILRGILISSIILLSAPFVAFFFKTEGATKLVYIISVVPFIKGFINPAIIKFQKELQFQREFIFRGFLIILESIFGIVFVVLFKDPIGIIYGLIMGAIAELFLSFILIRPIPKLSFDKESFKDVFHRGKWLTIGGILSYLYQNVDDAIVGRVLSVSSLGLYQMAYKISMLPITEVAQVVSRVTLPVYVKISDNSARLKKAYLKITLATSFLVIPVGLIFILFAEDVIGIILGKAWLPAASVFKVLAIFGTVRTIESPAHSLFMSLKKQKYCAAINGLSLASMVLTIIPLILIYQLKGAAISVVLGSLITIPLMIYYLKLVFKK